MTQVYDNISDLCRRNSITITALCRECRISRSLLTDYKMGRIKNLSVEVLFKISEYFGVTIEYIFKGRNINCSTDTDMLKLMLFGSDIVVTDEMWNELIDCVARIKSQAENKKTLA